MDIAIIFVTPVVLVIVGLLMVRFRRLAWRDDVGFQVPFGRVAALWLLAFIALATVDELLSRYMGLDNPSGTWRGKYDAANLAVRVLAIALVYPVAEEFFFRGALLGLLRRRFNAAVGVIGSALVFALVHVQYDWRGMLFILVDAVFFAVCRVRTNSLVLVILMHVLGNSFAVSQRIFG